MTKTEIKSYIVLLDDTDELNETVDSTDIISGRNKTELLNSFNDLIERLISIGIIEPDNYFDISKFIEIKTGTETVEPIPDIYNNGKRFDEIII